MDNICVKMCDPIEAEALRLYLEEFGITAVAAPITDGILTSLGSQPSLTSVLIRRQDLPATLEALRDNENDLATPQDITALEALLGE